MIAIVIPTVILLAGVADDLRSRKVHNWLVIVLLVAAAAFQFFLQGWFGLNQGLLGAATALAVGLPLVLMRLMGAGDMKLMFAFGMATSWSATFTVMIWALFWGAILGLVRAAVGGDLKKLMVSTMNVARGRSHATDLSLHKIPYTVALMFGWLSYLTLSRLPGGSL